jgi:hypothetical protein
MNWFRKFSQVERFDLYNYVSTRLNQIGVNNETYKDLALSPMDKNNPDPNHPDYQHLGWGSQNSVFKNKQTGKVEKFYPHQSFSPSYSFQNGKTKEIGQFYHLLSNVVKAVGLNASRKILNLIPMNTTVNRNGVIIEDALDGAETARWNDIPQLQDKSHQFQLDSMRTNGEGNVFKTPKGIAVVDGIQPTLYKGISDEQKEIITQILKEETEKIISNIKG